MVLKNCYFCFGFFASIYFNLHRLILMDFRYINTEYLEMLSGGDFEIIRELIDMFRDQSGEISREMRSCLMNNDFSSLGKLAHKAKSSVAIVGLNGLAEMLGKFELMTKERKQTEQYEAYITRFDQETKIAVKELDQYVNNSLNSD